VRWPDGDLLPHSFADIVGEGPVLPRECVLSGRDVDVGATMGGPRGALYDGDECSGLRTCCYSGLDVEGLGDGGCLFRL
jgi:hypothetical protein